MIKCNRCGGDRAFMGIVLLPLDDNGPSVEYDYCATCYDLLSDILAMFNTDGSVTITPGDMAMECGAES